MPRSQQSLWKTSLENKCAHRLQEVSLSSYSYHIASPKAKTGKATVYNHSQTLRQVSLQKTFSSIKFLFKKKFRKL